VIVRCIACLLVVALLSCKTDIPQEVPPRAAVVGPEVMTKTPWSYKGDDGVQLLSSNWRIRTTIKYDHIIDMLPSFYDALIHRYASVFGELPYPTEPLNVFLFAKEYQWQYKLEELLGDEASQWFKLGRGGVTIDGTAVLFDLDRRGRSRATLRIAAHEGWHQYAESVFAECLPTWLDEGLGTWMEGIRFKLGEVQFKPASNWDRLSSLRTIVNADRLTSLQRLLQLQPAELLEDNRTSLLGYYAQLWAFISFIMEFDNGKYQPALRSVLISAQEGTLRKPHNQGGWLLLFADDPERLEREYTDWVTQYVRPGGSWR